MSQYTSTRRAIVRARFTEGPTTFLAFQFLVISGLTGVHFHSWPVAIGVFMALSIGIVVPVIALLIVGTLSLAWCAFFVQTGWNLWGVPGVMTMGLFGSLVMIGFNVAGLEGFVDSF